MPNIHSYAPDPGTFRPSPEGISAWETAGRRLGPMYREAGEAILHAASLQERTLKQKLWPWNILELEEKTKERGTSIRVRGNTPPPSLRNRPEDMKEHNQINKGGAIFADAVDKMVGEAPAIEKRKMIDDLTGQELSNDPAVTVLFPGANDYWDPKKNPTARPAAQIIDSGALRGAAPPPGVILQEKLSGSVEDITSPSVRPLAEFRGYVDPVTGKWHKSGPPSEGAEADRATANALMPSANVPPVGGDSPWISGEGSLWDWMANALGTVSDAVSEANSAIGNAVTDFFSAPGTEEEVQY